MLKRDLVELSEFKMLLLLFYTNGFNAKYFVNKNKNIFINTSILIVFYS